MNIVCVKRLFDQLNVVFRKSRGNRRCFCEGPASVGIDAQSCCGQFLQVPKRRNVISSTQFDFVDWPVREFCKFFGNFRRCVDPQGVVAFGAGCIFLPAK